MLSRASGVYCAMVGKHDEKLAGEHLSSVDFTAPSKTLSRPVARGPGVSAMGGAGVGEGDRDSGFVAEGMFDVCKRRKCVTRPRENDR